MRLNKSFIVKRSSKAPRDMLNAFSQLSAYIRHSLDEGESIWIAQKEGRAKDGNDYTDPAILKMFYMEGRKRKLSFEAYLSSLRIVPVTISYEYDPCDLLKANEIFQKQTNGYYEKSEFEDIENIVRGITGKKVGSRCFLAMLLIRPATRHRSLQNRLTSRFIKITNFILQITLQPKLRQI